MATRDSKTATKRSTILRFLEQNAGITYSIDEVYGEMQAQGKDVGTRDSCATHLSSMAGNGEVTGVIRVGKGLYRYVGSQEARKIAEKEQQDERDDSVLFEKIGETKGGKLILQGTDNDVYIATLLSTLVD